MGDVWMVPGFGQDYSMDEGPVAPATKEPKKTNGVFGLVALVAMFAVLGFVLGQSFARSGSGTMRIWPSLGLVTYYPDNKCDPEDICLRSSFGRDIVDDDHSTYDEVRQSLCKYTEWQGAEACSFPNLLPGPNPRKSKYDALN
jgi:hypothetical protein